MGDRFLRVLVLFLACQVSAVFGGTEGSISGTVVDSQAISVSGAEVHLLTNSGRVLKSGSTSSTGTFQFFPVDFGDYVIEVTATGQAPYRTSMHVAEGQNSSVEVHLQPATAGNTASGKEMVMHVSAKRRVQDPAPTSSVEITKEKVEELPQGEAISLPKLVTTTSPGVVAGPFGQMFIRGNHANIQYQIDGVQLPDSPSNTFGDAFSPRNIDHMELITGGIPAEYGERLAAVMNIITKTGPETPGGSAELNYGSYNTFSPIATFGGSAGNDGNVHYFLSANYRTTDRGLDTPQPSSDSDITSGGTDAVHDSSQSNNEFAKIDWILDNSNKLTFIGFQAYEFYQIPDYPQSFGPGDPLFNTTDMFGNGPYNYVPYNTNDNQEERNAYFQAVWKHTFSERSFLQLAPYWKYSSIIVNNDLANDLASGSASASSFAENRTTNNLGVKGDYSLRLNDQHFIKAGFQAQASQATGSISIWTAATQNNPFVDTSPDTGYFEALYVQDDYSVLKNVSINAGIRFDATQFNFAGISPTDYAFQPRLGVSWLPTDTTKLHAFYGRLFQPAPVEDLRDAFSTVGGGQGTPYDIKAEQDNYYEVGIAQQVPFNQTISVNVYYKDATDMLDDIQLLNTSIAQPYNFATGYAYGVEASLQGHITDSISSYLNYSYEIAMGKGISGGIFAFPANQLPPDTYLYLDHVQVHTLNAGATYNWNDFWFTGQAMFGSGLRTGDNNTLSLPSHLTFDASLGYNFKHLSKSWWSDFKLSADVLNITNNPYPITIANGFNGSHYAAGREFFVHFIKEI